MFRGSRRCAGELVAVHARVTGTDDRARIAVVASKKVGSAVRRNRAKRLLREAARATPWRRGVDVVLVARPGCADSDLRSVRRDVTRCGGELTITRETTT